MWKRWRNRVTNEQLLAAINQQGVIVMGSLANLQAASKAISDGITAAIALINSLKTGSVSAADVDAVTAQLTTATADLNAAVNPPPAPTP